jgi:hypothetical protein
MYTVKTNQLAREHVALQMCNNHCQEYLHNVYELPSVKPTIWYLHGVAGFPTKASWLKAIHKGNYLSWPLINVKTLPSTSLNPRKLKRGTCVANARESDQQKWLNPPRTHQPIFPTRKRMTFSSRNTR